MRIAILMSALVATMILPFVAAADTVGLKNGVTLTGTVVGADGKTLTLKTDYADVINVKWPEVVMLTTDEAIFVVSAGNKTVNGKVTTEGTNLIVHTENAGQVSVALADVKVLRTPAAQAAYEKSLHPNLLQAWTGGVNLGFALARGNSNTTNLNIGFNALRKTRNDQITIYETSVYATNDEPGGGVTANAVLGGARYDRNISGKLFGFGSADYDHDELQDLILRSIYTGGLGDHAINNPNTTLDLLGGINYTRETYGAGATTTGLTTGVARNLPGITAGESLMHKFGAITTATEQFYFYPDLSGLSQYRFSLDAGAVTKINKWLGWQVSVSDRYVTNPPILGTVSNDVLFSTGVSFTFGQ